MSRTATPEQKAKAAERREVFKGICQRVSAMSEDQRAALALQCGPRKISGEPFSAFNSCLLLSQHNAPTICGGFHEWKKNGRKVCKGASGLMVWVPIGRKAKPVDGAELATDGAKPGFIPGYVFDVSQTEAIETEGGAS